MTRRPLYCGLLPFGRPRQTRSGEPLGLSIASWPERIYAIGDIHGRFDLLCALEGMIVADAQGCAGPLCIATLGDMIDRGPDSKLVLEHLMRPLSGFDRLALMGNHEAMILDFMAEPSPSSAWLRNGGLDTLHSFDVDPASLFALPYGERLSFLRSALGEPIVSFIRNLPAYAVYPNVLLVHAGIQPGVALQHQQLEDLLWIREPFLSARRADGLIVVHGHTSTAEPTFNAGRVGVDTGAVRSGILTAACLEPGKRVRFLATSS
jgi:serine/threonine protein phosphatase 1